MRATGRRSTVATLVALASLLAPSVGRAADGDGAYGRLDGDLGVQVGAGVALATGGASFAVGVRALFLETAGVYLHYEDALGGSGPAVARSSAVGVHVAPFFLARFAEDMEHGPARRDLFLDSLGLEVGAFWEAPRGAGFSPDAGLELGLTAAFPLFQNATGPFLAVRGALRWHDDDLTGHAQGNLLGPTGLVELSLAWQSVVSVHLVDTGDTLPR